MGFIDAVRDLAQQAGLAVPEEASQPGEREEAARQKQKQLTLSDVLARAAEGLSAPAEGERSRHRLPQGPRPERRDRGALRPRLRRRRLARPRQRLPELRRPAARGKRSGHRPCRRGTGRRRRRRRRAGKRYDRFRDRIMFPIRSVQGVGDRLRRPGPRPRRAEIPELARDAGLQQGTRALRPVRGPHGDPPARPCTGRRGLHGRRRAGPVRASTTRSRRSAPRAPPSTCKSWCASPTRSSSASTATPPAAAPRARALEASLPHAIDTRTFRFLFLPREHDPDSFVRELGAEAFETAIAAAVPLSRQIVARAGEDVDLATAEGRARFLAKARPLWSALPDGMLKRQLLGEIRVARRAVDRRDRRRVAGDAPGRRPVRGTRVRPAPVARRRPSRRARPPMWQPADRIAWMLLLESRWWDTLGAADHALLCAIPGWHGELFRFLDREATEHGAAAVGGAARAHRRRAVGGVGARARRRRGSGDRAARRGPGALDRPAAIGARPARRHARAGPDLTPANQAVDV